MTRLARDLQDVRRGPFWALLVLLGLCAGLTPFGGPVQVGRDSPARLGAVRAAMPAPSHRVSEQVATAEKAVTQDDGASLPPSFPTDVADALRFGPKPYFGQAAQNRAAQPVHPYRARAPPAL